jgi:hypothetical protein
MPKYPIPKITKRLIAVIKAPLSPSFITLLK